jgi:putative oxidoreductase
LKWGIMKKASLFKSQVLRTNEDSKIVFIRFIVGAIFIFEGILKYKLLEWLGPGRFTEIGFNHAYFWAYFTGAFEILCGGLILFGLLTRLASIPLLIIMIVAFFTVKLPLFSTKGFWTFIHEDTTDFSLTVLLILLLYYGGGRWSLDLKMASSEAQ